MPRRERGGRERRIHEGKAFPFFTRIAARTYTVRRTLNRLPIVPVVEYGWPQTGSLWKACLDSACQHLPTTLYGEAGTKFSLARGSGGDGARFVSGLPRPC